MIPGGTTGQILSKASNEDGDAQWVDNPQPVPIDDALTDLSGTDTLIVLRGDTPYEVTLATLASFLGGTPPADTEPAAFTSGQWTATAGVEQIVLNILALPNNGGSAITALQYRLDGGSWTALSGVGTGSRTITGLTASVEYDVEIRAVNAIGNGPASDTKSRTPTASGGGGTPGEIVAGTNSTDGVSMVSGFINQYGSSFHTPGGADFFTLENGPTKTPIEQSTAFLSPNLATLPVGATITSVQVEGYIDFRWMTPTMSVHRNYRDIQLVGGPIPGPTYYADSLEWQGVMSTGGADRSAPLAWVAAPGDGVAFTIPSSSALVAAVQAWADGSRTVPLWLQLTAAGEGEDMCIVKGNRVADVADGERIRVRIGYNA